MKVIKISQHGYCSGVKRALDLVENAIKTNHDNKHIYILGNIINNSYISKEFLKAGVITINSVGKTRLEMLEEIKDGLVILTAHGVSPEVYEYLDNKNIDYIDATCPFVKRVATRIKKHVSNDYDVIYIGKHNHPESEGIIGIDNNKIHLVTNIEEVLELDINSDDILIDTQTTLSDYYTQPIINAITKKYPHATLLSGVCDATTKRQSALMDEIEGELCIVVGDTISSNANELLKIAEKKMTAYLINDVSEIKKEWLVNVKTISLTSAASTPFELTNKIYEYLINYT